MKKFKKIYIEITNVCNLSCEFCPQTKRKSETITVDKFSEVLDKIKGHGDHIYLHVKGEPLLHPQLEHLLDVSYSKGFKVNITTNGTLINKVREKIINKPSLRQINFSLHSFDGNENSNDKYSYVNDILSFTKEAIERSSLNVSLRLWNLTEDNTINLKNKRNNYILEMIEDFFSLDYKIEEKVITARGIKLRERVYLNQGSEFKWPDTKLEDEDTVGFCHGLRNQIAILVDGTVVPCCLDGEGVINLGNIYDESSLNDIVEGERALSIFNGFSNRQVKEELCRKCDYRRRFSK
ncbi:radical SAM/SPASM domain-containing protein [Clostridium folliculivorans]|uniref:Radical SAM domain protein n=1 Tax=Clostridium folliculivorans TaxID=2886038 RepID=A0A9W6DCU1_9CLOT|nr:radical SAM/SPASM domain-containing protein [Clostridium folliculivorans]GKU27674.1 radical SAM domain protein [Clostridium folliculivorans]GKU32437.1 radical SAM domain protein [Clostridium folliculivorans]